MLNRPYRPGRLTRCLALAALGLVLSGCLTTYYVKGGSGHARGVASVAASLSDEGLARLTADMDPAMLALVRRHDPIRKADLWGRPIGWGNLDISSPPDLGFDHAVDQAAQEINALRPFSRLPIRPMPPLVLAAALVDQDRALTCLTQAVYYEAAREPLSGQEAVAQVVLNRMRHPAYPKSVCGVVYQGSARITGCQFTFTCDGSLGRVPEPGLWSQARLVAQKALGGYVARGVGSATHYHAVYVSPYWAPTLVKMAQIGAHIFYRWTGPWGEPPAFTGRYAGGEGQLSLSVLGGIDARTQGGIEPELAPLNPTRTVTLSVGGEERTYRIEEAGTLGALPTPGMGTLTASRRKPTPEEVRRINESLAAMDLADAPAPQTGAPTH
jgi:hypothetical protein